jgi:hypothetical protein
MAIAMSFVLIFSSRGYFRNNSTAPTIGSIFIISDIVPPCRCGPEGPADRCSYIANCVNCASQEGCGGGLLSPALLPSLRHGGGPVSPYLADSPPYLTHLEDSKLPFSSHRVSLRQ